MKHIFMGKIEYIEYVVRYRIPYRYSSMANYESEKSFNIIHNINDIPSFSTKGSPHPCRNVSDVKYRIMKESDNIEEKLHRGEIVEINDEELIIEKTVQCDNGDIICYIDKVLEKIIDEDSLKNTNEILEEIKKRRKEYYDNKNKVKTKNKKKWYQFWK